MHAGMESRLNKKVKIISCFLNLYTIEYSRSESLFKNDAE
ncbi:hypothetical protein HMPREF0083_05159 [Aneurinibacillus aneurinilyticus ATCC 12856]|uniref:Uncharacterized protein n=1 Tax=Aneurinibacillus aneurinilyticus ATCC 12856 TaxID=649747 RepID=U1Y3Q7_ANEAE|nr:hypothetical protein HMPREF0083_05159 [Aneurinibacillus aneurinilyticus ATCC 12856]